MPSTGKWRKHRAPTDIVHAAKSNKFSVFITSWDSSSVRSPAAARSRRCTVHDYLKRAETAGLPWPLPPGRDQAQLEEPLFGGRAVRAAGASPGRTRLRRDSRTTANVQACHLVVAVGRVHRGPSSRLPLQPLLRTLPALGAASSTSFSPGRRALHRHERSIEGTAQQWRFPPPRGDWLRLPVHQL